MTNREKFEAVFGVKFVEKTATFCAIASDEECNGKECENCRYNRWWEEEYKEDEGGRLMLKDVDKEIMDGIRVGIGQEGMDAVLKECKTQPRDSCDKCRFRLERRDGIYDCLFQLCPLDWEANQ